MENAVWAERYEGQKSCARWDFKVCHQGHRFINIRSGSPILLLLQQNQGSTFHQYFTEQGQSFIGWTGFGTAFGSFPSLIGPRTKREAGIEASDLQLE